MIAVEPRRGCNHIHEFECI